MKHLSYPFRLLYISFVLLKYGLDDIVFATHLFRPLRFLIWLSPMRWRYRHVARGRRLREALQELGPLFIKFGQLLSTRFDILPEDIVKELTQLQDKATPFPGEIAKKMIERTLGCKLSDCFQYFDIIPLASASVAQVHCATLLNGHEVVIKVLRPQIEKKIKKDLNILRIFAHLCQKYWKKSRQFKPREIVAELGKSLLDELDLMREASNASQFKRNFKEVSFLHIPEIYWNFTTSSVLTMERVYGTSVLDLETLSNEGIDRSKLAKLTLEVFFTQVFRDCFFHADMHPGNIRVTRDPLNHLQLIMIDFGIVGILSPTDQHYLAENFIAFLNRDYRRVAELHIESGWVPQHTRIDEFESAIRSVCEPMLERPLKTVSLGNLLFKLFQTAARFEVNIQPQLILLQKNLVYIEGLSRKLYPDIDLWQTAKPILEKWVKNQIGLKAFLHKMKIHAPLWLEKIPELPNKIHSALNELSEIKKTLQTHDAQNQKTSTSYKDICIGLLLGISLSLLCIVLRSYV